MATHAADVAQRVRRSRPFRDMRARRNGVEFEVAPLTTGHHLGQSSRQRRTQANPEDGRGEHDRAPPGAHRIRMMSGPGRDAASPDWLAGVAPGGAGPWVYAALPGTTGSAVVISSVRVFSGAFTIGIVISSTPSCMVALASSGFTPSGSGMLR